MGNYTLRGPCMLLQGHRPPRDCSTGFRSHGRVGSLGTLALLVRINLTFHTSPSWGRCLLGKCLNIWHIDTEYFTGINPHPPSDESSWLFLLHHHGDVFVKNYWLDIFDTPAFPSGWILITQTIIWLFMEQKMFNTSHTYDNINPSYVALITKWFHAASGPGCQRTGS